MKDSRNNAILTILMGIVTILMIITSVFTISVNSKVKDIKSWSKVYKHDKNLR